MERLKRRWRPLLVVALALAAGFALTLARGTAFADAQTPPRLTSVQIADAVLFADGPAAVYLSSLERERIHWTPELRSVQKGITAAIAADGTGYYGSEFAPAMQSGDPRLVQQALGELGATVRTYLEQRFGADQVEEAFRKMDTTSPRPDRSRGDSSPVLVFYVVAVTVAVLVFYILWAIPSPTEPTDQGVTAEKLVNGHIRGTAYRPLTKEVARR